MRRETGLVAPEALSFWTTPWAMATQLLEQPGWPAVDLYQDGDGLVLEAELPGLRPEDIDVVVEPSAVRLQGRRQYRSADGLISERFERMVPLPFRVDPASARAELRHGLLHLALERRGREGRRRIEVTVDGDGRRA
jgi:HSP20 family protein